MDEPFKSAPDLGQSFEASSPPEGRDAAREYDAADWEPSEDREDDSLDEFIFDPPRREFDPEVALEPTPFGTVEREVRRELDLAARRAMHEARERPREVEDDFADLRSIDEVPGAGAEYEEHLRQTDDGRDDYEARLIDRFNRMKERSKDRER